MLILQILRSFLFGLIFTLISVSLTAVLAYPIQQVYHTISNLKENSALIAIVLVSVISISVWHHLSWGQPYFTFELLTLFLMSLLGNFDTMTGRIPVHFLILGLVLGLLFGLEKKQFFAHVIGGLSNLVLSIVIFLTGQYYAQQVLNYKESKVVFGLGDVYASGGVGFLLGLASGTIVLILTLILAVLFAGVKSIHTGEEFLKKSVLLGPSFFLATALLFVVR